MQVRQSVNLSRSRQDALNRLILQKEYKSRASQSPIGHSLKAGVSRHEGGHLEGEAGGGRSWSIGFFSLETAIRVLKDRNWRYTRQDGLEISFERA